MASIASTPGLTALDLINNTPTASKISADTKAKAHKQAQDFEAMFLNSMFQEMLAGVKGEGPFGGDGATGVWRSFMTDEYSKAFAKAGGIGIADEVYRSLIAQQEAHA
jgi:flagellar protein FlgJ